LPGTGAARICSTCCCMSAADALHI
jgi:hypothetical protein